MAIFYSTIQSDSVKNAMGITVIIPQHKHIRCAESPELEKMSFRGPYPLLLLLHDEASSQGELLRMTSLERFAADKGIAVAIPDGMLSFYTDYFARDPGYPIPGVKYSNPDIEAKFTEMQFETYIYREVLEYVRNVFPVSRKKEETFIGGIGMGGFGAVKLALKAPEIFGKVFSINGYLDIRWMMEHEAGRKEQFDAIFGGEVVKGTAEDLPSYLSSKQDEIPAMYQVWEKSHRSAEMNRNFSKAAEKYTAYQKEETEEGSGFANVDRQLEKMINWLK